MPMSQLLWDMLQALNKKMSPYLPKNEQINKTFQTITLISLNIISIEYGNSVIARRLGTYHPSKVREHCMICCSQYYCRLVQTFSFKHQLTMSNISILNQPFLFCSVTFSFLTRLRASFPRYEKLTLWLVLPGTGIAYQAE